MIYKIQKSILLTSIIILLGGCGSGDGTSSGSNAVIPYTELNSSTGFSSSYLSQKSFFRPENYQVNNFIEVHEFTDSNVSWSDNFFNNNGSANYTIVNSNGFNGVIQYNDGIYDLHYNILSVETDHVKVCYTYTGIDTVALCDTTQSLNWYFDRASAEANYP